MKRANICVVNLVYDIKHTLLLRPRVKEENHLERSRGLQEVGGVSCDQVDALLYGVIVVILPLSPVHPRV